MKKFLLWGFVLLGIGPLISEAAVKNPWKSLNSSATKEHYLPILNRWSGDFPVDQLYRLKGPNGPPQGGYIGNPAAFVSFWEAFRPGSVVPVVDFSKNIVVFVIGEKNYRHLFVAKVTLKDAIAEVVADGDTSGAPREGRVPMALAEIPRAGVQFVGVGQKQIAVE